MPNVQYFLGANSPQGFYSLYDQLIDCDTARAVYILKGGPGCGKSTLMRRVALRAEQAGLPVEHILCSGDPASLDGVVLPTLGVALVDGTAPHVVEPKLPGAVEHYVNLGACYDAGALSMLRGQLKACMTGYKACYQQAYGNLSAAAQVQQDTRATLLSDSLREKMQKRAAGILTREVPRRKHAPTGGVRQRFLSGMTCRGRLLLSETAAALCPRVYHLCDRYGLAHEMLSTLLTGIRNAGHHAIACPSPMAPLRLEAVLVPKLGLAFLSCPGDTGLPSAPYRRVHIDAMIDPALLRENRGRLRLFGRIADQLEEGAVDSLARAKAMHDELEALYNPHVDFDRVEHTAEQILGQIGL